MAAFEQLYRAYAGGLLHRVIRPRVAVAADADDVLVDTFTTALERLDQFHWRGRSFFSWLARIAANKCHDAGRRLGRAERARAALKREPAPTPARPEELALAASDRASMRERIELVLGELNPRYARAITLRLVEERAREECAQLMDVKLGTFDVVLLRAVRSFRKRWAQRFGEETV